MSETVETRKLMALAIADKTFTLTVKTDSGESSSIHTGTLELEGSFAVIREWDILPGRMTGAGNKTLKAIKIVPADRIISIIYVSSPVVNLTPRGLQVA